MGTPGIVDSNSQVKLSFDKQVQGELMFHRFDPPGLSLDHVNHNTWTTEGKLQPNNGSGTNPLQGEWGLERVLDKTGKLFDWFQKVQNTGRVDENTATATVDLLNSKNEPLGTWTLANTTPIHYQQAGMDANSNAILTESIRFYSTDIKWKGAG